MAKIPKFRSLKEESDFWDTHSVADYWDELEDVKGPFIDARPPKKLVPIRLDEAVIRAAKRIARRKGVGYQTLLRMWAYEGLAREMERTKAPARRQTRSRKSA